MRCTYRAYALTAHSLICISSAAVAFRIILPSQVETEWGRVTDQRPDPMKTGRKSRQHLRWDRAVANETARSRLPISCIRPELSICEMMAIASEARYPSGPAANVEYSGKNVPRCPLLAGMAHLTCDVLGNKACRTDVKVSVRGPDLAAVLVGTGKSLRAKGPRPLGLRSKGIRKHDQTLNSTNACVHIKDHVA